jgi:hypothetical protein
MGFTEVVALMAAVCAGALLWGNLKAREAANSAIRQACQEHQLLFLNDTVALESLWPVRDANGVLRLRRLYSFEYSDTGHNRRKGTVSMIAGNIFALSVEPSLPEHIRPA